MVTYLATTTEQDEDTALAFCSANCCVEGLGPNWEELINVQRDDSYEFDEVCANCGVLIPASAHFHDFGSWRLIQFSRQRF
jgi:hypothetical protein